MTQWTLHDNSLGWKTSGLTGNQPEIELLPLRCMPATHLGIILAVSAGPDLSALTSTLRTVQMANTTNNNQLSAPGRDDVCHE